MKRRQVVGVSCDADLVDCRAVIWDHGNTPTDLNDLKAGFSASLESAKDINNKGEITGRADRSRRFNGVFGGARRGTLTKGKYGRVLSARTQLRHPQAHNAGCRFIESTSGIFLFARISRTFGANFPYWVR